MTTSNFSQECTKISLDSIDEDTEVPWYSLIQNLSHDQLLILEEKFKQKYPIDDTNSEKQEGLSKEQFLDVVCEIYNNHNYSVQSLILFDNISKGEKFRITWNDFLDFLIENLEPQTTEKLWLTLMQIEPSPQTKRDTIVKIVLIETKKYFCYAMLSKYGKVGLYDGNLNYLTGYHVAMTRADLSKTEEERRRRNRWITDAIFCPDVLMFIVTNSARSILIYEASGLNHTLLWMILSAPNIIECMAYKCFRNEPFKEKSVLFMGQSNGDLLTFEFQQPKISLMRKKHNDKLSLFYWAELPDEKEFVVVKWKRKLHRSAIRHIKYFEDNNTVVTCSRDRNASVIKHFHDVKRKSYCFKMPMGATTFALSRKLKLLLTGGDDGIIRMWNSVITSQPTSTLYAHSTGLVDIQIAQELEIFFSCSRDGIIKVWDITNNRCIQSINIKFPSFGIQGKTIEWGIRCIYPGPKRKPLNENQKETDVDYSNFDFRDTEKKIVSEVEDSKSIPDVWERSFLLVTCCNYVAKINVAYQDENIKKRICAPLLQPPPLQNSVLIPVDWAISEKLCARQEPDESIESTQINLDELGFILNKDLLENQHSDINFRIGCLERKKLMMQKFVAQGAPYLALDLYEIAEITIPDYLSPPTKKKTKDLIEKTKQLLIDSSHKDEIFSNSISSSSRSKSSRSSIIELPL